MMSALAACALPAVALAALNFVDPLQDLLSSPKAIDPDCGWETCPGCSNSHTSADADGADPPYCPANSVDDSVKCSVLASEVSGGSNDFARCETSLETQLTAAGYFFEQASVSPCSAVECPILSKDECDTITVNTTMGNCCQ